MGKKISLDEVKKLDVKEGDTIVIHPASWAIKHLKEISKITGCNVIVVEPEMIGVLKTSIFKK